MQYSMAMQRQKLVVMLGVHPDSIEKGGIHSVVDVYKAGGLFDRWPILYIGTVASGPPIFKVRVFAKALGAFLSVVLTGRVALVHAQSSSRASFWRKSIFILVAFMARRPVIFHLHGSEFEHFYREECGVFRKWLVRSVLNRVDRVVVLSSQWRRIMQSIAPDARIVTIFNPAPLLDAASAFNARVERTSNLLLFLGRFGARKGIHDLLQALVIVKTRFPTVHLRCGGDGDAQGVKAHAIQLGLADCVSVLGWVNGAAKAREIAQAAIYVLPSHAEGLPMGVLEAMAGGAPVVSTTVGGIPDAVEDGVGGFLVTPGDTHALADRIMCLLDNVELRKAFAAEARRKAQKQFSVENVLSQVEALYAELGARPHEPQERDQIANEPGESRDGATA